MTRRQRYYLGHCIAYIPMLCLSLYVGFCRTWNYEASNLIAPLAVVCMVLFGVGLIIRDKPAK